MSPQMVDSLLRISQYYAPEPDAVCDRIVEEVAAAFSRPHSDTQEPAGSELASMAMLNLIDHECLRFKCVVNKHPLFANGETLAIRHTLCQFAMQAREPLLVQDAAAHPEFRRHAVVRLKLRRYLGVPVWSSDREVIGTLCILDDHTDLPLGQDHIQYLSVLAMRVSVELERERLTEARVAEQRAHAERLEKDAAEKRRFVSMVIHDLRHPLSSMMTSVHLLRMASDSQPGRRHRDEHIHAIENRTRLLSSLLDELVLYDQIEAGVNAVQCSEFDIAPFLTRCIQEVAGLSDNPDVRVSCEFDLEIQQISADASKLRHVVINLVANAIKFTNRGTITVRTRAAETGAIGIEVEDTGIGMNHVEIERIFEPYYTGGSHRDGGAGLGLAIAHRLCAAMDIKISVRSEEGVGSCFTLILPKQTSQES